MIHVLDLRRKIFLLLTVAVSWHMSGLAALAGMPTPYLVFTELGKRRLEEISFFLVGFLLFTAVCRWCWNSLAKEFPKLPLVSYRGALGVMFLWGLAMTVVLSLISGARELMTPAAWEPNGVTQRLAKKSDAVPVNEIKARHERIAALKAALWQYAADHDSHFPDQIDSMPADIVIADSVTKMPFLLQPHLMISSPRTVLASEPDLYVDRMQLWTDGAIETVKRPEESHP